MAIDRITTGAVLDGAIATADIADDAVTGAKIENNPTVAGNLATGGTLAIAGHGSIGNAGTVDGTRALTVVGASDGTGSSIFVGYNSSLSSKFGIRDDGYTTVGAGMNVQGNISVPSSSGIDFSGHPHANGMTSELLDDYEEGTWTPEVASVNAHHSRTGVYTKIGNMVHIQCVVHFTQAGTTFGSLSGLPYVVSDINYSPLVFREWYSTGITMSANLVIGGQSTSGFRNYANSTTAVNNQQYGYALSTTYRTS